MNTLELLDSGWQLEQDERVMAAIVTGLVQQGYAVIPNALPADISAGLFQQLLNADKEDFSRSGIGRDFDHQQNSFVRRDHIKWIAGETEAETCWLAWIGRLRLYLNQSLFLGLFSFESHFAHYAPGAFYKKHLDAFKGQANRILSTVFYLNPGWEPSDGGELVIYSPESDEVIHQVSPVYGTLVVFLSEDFPHEVAVAHRHRYSVAGWFRVNSSLGNQIDPPR